MDGSAQTPPALLPMAELSRSLPTTPQPLSDHRCDVLFMVIRLLATQAVAPISTCRDIPRLAVVDEQGVQLRLAYRHRGGEGHRLNSGDVPVFLAGTLYLLGRPCDEGVMLSRFIGALW